MDTTSSHGTWQERKILIVVRTYPTPAQRGVEVSCTAGITDDGQWIRLFPVPYRFLEPDRRFKKYQWITARVKKASDSRPESFHPDLESIVAGEIVPTNRKWAARKEIVFPIRAHCLCCLKDQRERNGHPTLGIFKPKTIRRLLIETDDEGWTPDQLSAIRQFDLFQNAPQSELEKIPFKFKYDFTCDEANCDGHSLSCTDWEMAQAYRSWRREYGGDWESKFRHRFEHEMIEVNDTHFYVGTVHRYPATWIIVGLFYPRR